MHDQAEKLRLRLRRQTEGKTAQTVAVISGKGGVGKSNFILNFAISLSRQGRRVLLFDMDIGMGNVHLLAGLSPKASIVDFLTGACSLPEIIEKGPESISFISGGSGLSAPVKWEPEKIAELQREIRQLMFEYDDFLFDFGAGMQEETVRLLLGMDHVITIVTPEVTSIMDAYSAMKLLILNAYGGNLYLVGNRMKNEKENFDTLNRLQNALSRFLHQKVPVLGYLPEDAFVVQAAKLQIPFLLYKENGKAAKNVRIIAERFTGTASPAEAGGTGRFLERLKDFLSRK